MIIPKHMDTIPFHLILFALDIVVLGGLYLWLRFHRRRKAERVYRFEKSLYTPITASISSFRWDFTGFILFGVIGLVGFAVLSRLIFTDFVQEHIYRFNVGQCIAEGLSLHASLSLFIAALLLLSSRRFRFAILLGCCSLLPAFVGFYALYWEPYSLKVEHYEIKTSKIKKPLRIVFVSDIQTDRISRHEINTLKKIQEQNADLILLGGDYIQSFAGPQEDQLHEKFRQLFIRYPLEAPLGVYAIPGNIGGRIPDAELFKGTGVRYIQNFGAIDHLGREEGWTPPIDLIFLGRQTYGGVGKQGLTDSGNFIVMIGHEPNYAIDGYTNPKTGNSLSGYRNAERAPDLMLAGHTHGGQVMIPFYGAFSGIGDARAQQVPRYMMSGFFTYPNGGHLLITRGSGMERGWAPRLRFFCPPEISVIDIMPQ